MKKKLMQYTFAACAAAIFLAANATATFAGAPFVKISDNDNAIENKYFDLFSATNLSKTSLFASAPFAKISNGGGGEASVAGYVGFFSDANWRGRQQWLTSGTYYYWQLNQVGDNSISSMKIPGGMWIRTCDDASRASCWWFDRGDYRYIGDGQNDRVSYIEIYPQ